MALHPSITEPEGWATLETTPLYENPHIEVAIEKVQTPSRPDGVEWTIVRRKAACVVVPVTERGGYLLIQQERVPVRSLLWEFPAGQIDSPTGHTPALLCETALRELREESGYELPPGRELLPLGQFFPSSGITDELSHLFLAEGVVPSPRGIEHDENEAILHVREFTAGEVQAMVARGEIRDANSLASFARLCAMGRFPLQEMS